MLNRREMLAGLATSAAMGSWVRAQTTPTPPPSPRLGLVSYSQSIRRRVLSAAGALDDLFEPVTLLHRAHELGAAGLQADLGRLDSASAERVQAATRQHGMFLEAIVKLPEDAADVSRFEADIVSAQRCGALAARTVMLPGRRYEYFDSLEHYRQFDRRGRRSLELAAPVVQRHQFPLAVENHKDHRIDERVALLEHLSSEFVGACFDTGNSLALLEDTLEVARALAPWTINVHLKDQAVLEYDDGFLLGDVPLGAGALDLKQMVDTVRRARPQARFHLELITRDPLKVPCLADKYWATFPTVSGLELARTLNFVRQRPARQLQQVSQLSSAAQLALEDDNMQQSFAYARQQLDL